MKRFQCYSVQKSFLVGGGWYGVIIESISRSRPETRECLWFSVDLEVWSWPGHGLDPSLTTIAIASWNFALCHLEHLGRNCRGFFFQLLEPSGHHYIFHPPLEPMLPPLGASLLLPLKHSCMCLLSRPFGSSFDIPISGSQWLTRPCKSILGTAFLPCASSPD